MYVDYEPTYAHAIDVDTVSPARMRYIERQARKKGLSVVDYAGGKRKTVSWSCTMQYTTYRFTTHCLERYWQRSKMGNGTNTFKDFPLDTIEWLGPYAKLGEDLKILRQYIPYEDGVFVAEIVLNPVPKITHNHLEEIELTIPKQPGANCITFLHCDDLSAYQQSMVKAIRTRNRQRYEELIKDDKRASYKLVGSKYEEKAYD